MNPKEFVSILVDAKNEFENWYNTQEKDTNKEDMESAYLAAYSTILAKISLLLGDNLYSSNDEEEIPESKAFEYYIGGALSRTVKICADDLLKQPLVDCIEKYEDLAFKQIRTIMSGYTGKKIESDEDDDGIEGAEADQRSIVFNNTLSAITLTKEGALNKKAVANTFRALADFYDSEW